MQLQNLINMVCCLQRGFNFLRYSHCLIGQFWPLTRFSYIFVSPVVVPEIFTSLELGCCNNQLIRATYCHISDSMVNFIMELGMDTINFPHFEQVIGSVYSPNTSHLLRPPVGQLLLSWGSYNVSFTNHFPESSQLSSFQLQPHLILFPTTYL